MGIALSVLDVISDEIVIHLKLSAKGFKSIGYIRFRRNGVDIVSGEAILAKLRCTSRRIAMYIKDEGRCILRPEGTFPTSIAEAFKDLQYSRMNQGKRRASA